MNYQGLCILLTIIPAVICLEIIPNQPELVIKTVNGRNFTLICHDTENITWTTYPQNRDSIHHFDYHHENQNHVSTLTITNITYMDTGYYNCSKQRNRHAVAGIYVYVFDGEHYLALEEEYVVFQSSENKSLIIPCKPTLPNISVTMENQEDDYVINFSYDPKVGHVLQSPTVKDSKVFQCVGIKPDDSTVERVTVRVIINPVTDRSVKPRIDLAGGWKVATEGSPFSLNCSVQLKIRSSVFLNWKYPNEDVKNRSIEQTQLETFGEYMKNNYKVLTISNLTKFDTGNYTCEVEDLHSGYTANTSYYVNVFDANDSFLDFKILTDLTNHTQKTGYEKIQWMFNVTSYPPAKVSCKFPNGQSISTIDSTIPNKYQLTLMDRELKFVMNVLEINDTGTYVFTADNGLIKRTVNSSILVVAP